MRIEFSTGDSLPRPENIWDDTPWLNLTREIQDGSDSFGSIRSFLAASHDLLPTCVLCIPGVWSGVQNAKYQEATELMTESVRAYNDGNTQLLIDSTFLLPGLNPQKLGETIRANAVASRFSSEFKPAFKAWIAQAPGRPREPYQKLHPLQAP